MGFFFFFFLEKSASLLHNKVRTFFNQFSFYLIIPAFEPFDYIMLTTFFLNVMFLLYILMVFLNSFSMIQIRSSLTFLFCSINMLLYITFGMCFTQYFTKRAFSWLNLYGYRFFVFFLFWFLHLWFWTCLFHCWMMLIIYYMPMIHISFVFLCVFKQSVLISYFLMTC